MALIVGGWNTWVPGLWHDEVATLVAADRSWESLAIMLRELDAVHGLYYALMHVWVDVMGTSALALRLPSVLAVAGTAATMTALAQREWGPTAGMVAGISAVLVPRSLWMAGEARSYALATFLVALAVYAFWRALNQNQRRWWVLYGFLVLLAALVFMHSLLILPSLAVTAWAAGWGLRQGRRFWIATVGGTLVACPVVFIAVTQRGQIAFLAPVTVQEIALAPAQSFFGGASMAHAVAWTALTTACAVPWAWATRRARPRERAMVTLAVSWLLLPMVTLLLVSVVQPLWLPRYASISTPALALVFAGATALVGGNRWQAAALGVSILVFLSAPSLLGYRHVDSKGDLLGVVNLVETRRRAGDSLWFAPRPRGSDRTPRIVRYAYPHAFEGMTDLTLEKTFEDSGVLFETELPLTAVEPQLRAVRRLIGIQYLPPGFAEDYAAADFSHLAEAGLNEVDRQSVGQWIVVVLERS